MNDLLDACLNLVMVQTRLVIFDFLNLVVVHLIYELWTLVMVRTCLPRPAARASHHAYWWPGGLQAASPMTRTY